MSHLFKILILSSFLFSQDFKQLTIPKLTTENIKTFGSLVFDFDNNGKMDLFIATMGSKNLLFINNGNLNFTKVESNSLTHNNNNSFSISAADYNNDGYLDIFISNYGQPNELYMGKAKSEFELVPLKSEVLSQAPTNGAAWVDINNDSFLDLFILNGNNVNNQILLNKSNNVFDLQSQHILSNDNIGAHSASWADYDNDGDSDVFIATNYEGKNLLYRNDGNGKFTKILEGEIVNDIAVSISSIWADYDNDGDLDLYVSNSMGKANFHYQNLGNGLFKKIINGAYVNDIKNSMNASFIDIDNDGDLDLYVVNSGNTENDLYKNNGKGIFDHWNSILNKEKKSSRSALWMDIDMDGDLDVLITNAFGTDDKDDFYINDLNSTNRFFKLTCIGKQSNRSAIGTRVEIEIEGLGKQIREITQQNMSYSSIPFELHFGLANNKKIKNISILWPSGIRQSFTNIKSGTYQIIESKELTLLDGNK